MAKIAINTTRYVVMKVSPAVFEEIELRLRMTTNEHPFHLMDTGQGRIIDMSGLCIAPDPELAMQAGPMVDLKAMIDEAEKNRISREPIKPQSEENSETDEEETKRITKSFPPLI
jgi:hypothetical protein